MERDEIIHVYGRQPNQLRYVNDQLRCQKEKPHVTISNYEHRSIIKSAIFKMIESANSMFAKKIFFFCFLVNNDCFSSSLLIWSSSEKPFHWGYISKCVGFMRLGMIKQSIQNETQKFASSSLCFLFDIELNEEQRDRKCIHACTCTLNTLCTYYTVEWKTKIQTRQRSNT